jgi:hypothetical protein
MGPRWPGSACNSFAFLMRSKLRVGAEVAGRAVMNLSRSWSYWEQFALQISWLFAPMERPRTRQKLSEAILCVEVFHTAPTRLS